MDELELADGTARGDVAVRQPPDVPPVMPDAPLLRPTMLVLMVPLETVPVAGSLKARRVVRSPAGNASPSSRTVPGRSPRG